MKGGNMLEPDILICTHYHCLKSDSRMTGVEKSNMYFQVADWRGTDPVPLFSPAQGSRLHAHDLLRQLLQPQGRQPDGRLQDVKLPDVNLGPPQGVQDLGRLGANALPHDRREHRLRGL